MPGIDINCDLGEGIGNDVAIMPYITSANIACCYHAGDEYTMWQTVELALKHNVAIGAHPSFPDKKNFGRKEIVAASTEIYNWVQQQLKDLKRITEACSAEIRHVKPHGALYNMAAKDASLAATIVAAVKDFDKELLLFGLSGSILISEAQKAGLKIKNEVFADRTYQDDGSLTPRALSNALIEDEEKAVAQVLQMVQKGVVTTISGKQIPIITETICIHGDGKHAVEFAKKISEHLRIKQ